jgi:hypothetical protein
LLDAFVSKGPSRSFRQRRCTLAGTRPTDLALRNDESGINHADQGCCHKRTCNAVKACIAYINGCTRENTGRIQGTGIYNSDRDPKVTDTASKARVADQVSPEGDNQTNTGSRAQCFYEHATIFRHGYTDNKFCHNVSPGGHTVSTQGYTVSIQSYTGSTQGHTVSIQSYTVSTQGYTVSIQGYAGHRSINTSSQPYGEGEC